MDKIKELQKNAIHNRIPIMQEEGIDFMLDYIRQKQYKEILEIGTAVGYSTIRMALLDPDIRITTIEINSERFEEAVKNVTAFQLQNQVELILMDAISYQPTQQFDFIFLDASKSQYQKMFQKFYPCLKEGGSILIDNLEFHGFVDHPEQTKNRNTRQMVGKIKRFRDELLMNKEYDVQYFKEVGDGIMIIRK